jgi:transposase
MPRVVAALALFPDAADRVFWYFEGIDSERGLEWRCCDSLSLREFLRLVIARGYRITPGLAEPAAVCWKEVHDKVFTWVLARLGEHGRIKGERIGLEASTMEASAALRAIVRRDSGEGYREMLARMAPRDRDRDAYDRRI